MTLSDFASIGSLFSALAVLVSLVYLSLQVRQAEKNQRALMNQGTIDRVSSSLQFSAEPHINALFTRVIAGDSDFTAPELNQLSLIMRIQLISIQDTVLQREQGLIDQVTFDNGVRIMGFMLTWPVYRALWLTNRETFTPELGGYVDKWIAERPAAQAVNVVANFQANLAKVTR